MREPTVRGLERLVHALELRWRAVLLLRMAVNALSVSLGVSLAALLMRVASDLTFSIPAVLLLLNGSAAAAAILIAALAGRDATVFLIDADRVYHLHSLLLSGHEFADAREASDAGGRAAFEQIVVARAARAAPEIDPRRVYPAGTPRRAAVVGCFAVAIATVLVLDASGVFARPVAPFAQDGLLLEDAGRRLAARADRDEQLLALADEFGRLSELLQRGEADPDEARRRVESLGERVEQQLRDIERTAPFDDDGTTFPPEAEAAIRTALRSGMSESQVVEFFVRMRSQGETIPDIVEALDEAPADRVPDTTLGLSDEQIRSLIDQINRPTPDDAVTDLTEELRESQRVLQQMGAGLAELTEGQDERIGEAEDSGVGRDPTSREMRAEEVQPEDASGDTAQGDGGREGGTVAAEPRMDGDHRRPEEGPIFRELRGIVTDGTIMEIIIRDLPAEATSKLSEQERAVMIERVVEEAVSREAPPPEIRSLVRNYFLRLAGTGGGSHDEQE